MDSCNSYQNGTGDENVLPPQDYSTNSYSECDEVEVYTRRWYILVLYCGVSALQSIIWNTWGPIQATARAVYLWDDYVIDLMPAWGDITYCIIMAPFAWVMDVKGLRVAVLLAAGLEFFGSALRCIPTNDPGLSTALIYCGQIINGFAGPVSMAAPALLSSTWFPPHQRTTATAISTMAGYAGTAISFLIGPAFVDDVESTNITKIGDNYVLNATQYHQYRNQIKMLLYFEAGVILAIFLVVLIYYPAKPAKPPSHSAGAGRVDFKNGLKKLLNNYNYLLLVLLYGASTGIYSGWLSVLDQNLSEFHVGNVGQKFAGWLGFVAIISGSFAGVFFSLFADHFSGHLKLILIVFMALSFYTILLICYIFTKVIPFNEILVYVMFGLNGFFLNGTIPFFFELGVEITYPVAEGITSGVITFSNNFIQSIFLVVPLGNFSTKWMIWATAFTCAASTVFLLCVKERYNRSTVDRQARSSALDPN